MDSGDACAGVGEDEAEEGEADPSRDVEAAACGGDWDDNHDGEAGKRERDDEFEVEAVGICGEYNQRGVGHVGILREVRRAGRELRCIEIIR